MSCTDVCQSKNCGNDENDDSEFELMNDEEEFGWVDSEDENETEYD